MAVARNGSRALGPQPKAGVSGKQTPAGPIDGAQSGGGSVNAPDFGVSQPLTVARQTPLPLATFQRTTPYEKQNIAEFLTFKEAIWLMLASKLMHSAIRKHPLLKLNEIIASFNQLHLSIQSTEAGISALRLIRVPPGVAVPGFTFVGHNFKLPQTAATKALQAKETLRQAQEYEKNKAQEGQLAKQREALEHQVQELWIHFESAPTMGPSPVAPRKKIQVRLQTAIDVGDVELVRADLREFLSLPVRLMPSARKVAGLQPPEGIRSTLEIFGQHCCGTFQPLERLQYDAIAAYVNEIVSSKFLSLSEKHQLCVRQAVFPNNSAVAASILLGIHESSADPEDKQWLLMAVAALWDVGLGKCVDRVCGHLQLYHHRAPDWVDGVLARLESIKLTLPETAVT